MVLERRSRSGRAWRSGGRLPLTACAVMVALLGCEPVRSQAPRADLDDAGKATRSTGSADAPGAPVTVHAANAANAANAASADAAKDAKDATTLGAAGRALDWLREHPPAAGRSLGVRVLDLMAWQAFASLHPDDDVRREAGLQLDRRLATIEEPRPLNFVALSYWVTVLRFRDLRGRDVGDSLPALAGHEATLADATATTRIWIEEQMRRFGAPVRPDLESGFIATRTAAGLAAYEPVDRDAYSVYHELAPLCDFGREGPHRLSAAQRAFVSAALPSILSAARQSGDTDAVAEGVIAASLIGDHASPATRDAVQWLVATQREDGAFRSKRDRPDATADHFRHAVFVVSWALLGSLDGHARLRATAAAEDAAVAEDGH